MRNINNKLYVIAEASNVDTDIAVSECMNYSAAQQFLHEAFDAVAKNVFGEKDLGEEDIAECAADSYQVYDSRTRDLYYGHMKEILVPLPCESPDSALLNLQED